MVGSRNGLNSKGSSATYPAVFHLKMSRANHPPFRVPRSLAVSVRPGNPEFWHPSKFSVTSRLLLVRASYLNPVFQADSVKFLRRRRTMTRILWISGLSLSLLVFGGWTILILFAAITHRHLNQKGLLMLVCDAYITWILLP